MPTPIQQALDEVEKLEVEEQQAVVEIIRQRLLERRRAEIAENARATVQDFRQGRAQSGTVDDLRHDLAGCTLRMKGATHAGELSR